MSVLPNQRLSQVLSTWGQCFCFCPAGFIYRPRTQTSIVLFSVSEKAVTIGIFPNLVLMELSRTAFPMTVPPKDDRADFAREGRLGLPCWTMILAIVCVGRHIQISGHSDFAIYK